MKPNFLFIGPDKTGSTWLYEILRQHPDCYVPPVKDIYFFDRHYDRGLDWYQAFFEEAPPAARAVGELSHDYLFSREAAHRIARDLPEARLLTCLREPVERTFSHYLFLVRSGQTQARFEEALERFPGIVDHSRYHYHLREYLRLFDRARLKVLWFDKLRADPRGFARDVFEFLGVSFVEDIQYEERHLAASRPRSRRLARLARIGAVNARRIGLARLVGVVKRGPVANLLYRPYGEVERPTMRPETRARLCELFRPDVLALEELLGVALPAWLDEEAPG